MRILIATALYPPDTAPAASYAKELARRLSAVHDVHVVCYGEYPESLPNVTMARITKRMPRALRIPYFFLSILKAALASDVLLCVNGPSVELPLALVSLITQRPLILLLADKQALQSAGAGSVRGMAYKNARSIAHAAIERVPPPRPEVLPFSPPPADSMRAYEDAWVTHLAAITALC